MKAKSFIQTLIILPLCVFVVIFNEGYAENMDPDEEGSHYGWSENAGWINFKPSFGPGVTVTNRGLSGYAWGENIGWINLSLPDIGVFNDGNGNLSGFAWAENVGWISFSCENSYSCTTVDYGVYIDACGDFNGTAWGENIGWISFRSDGDHPFYVRTSWVSPIDEVPPVTEPEQPFQEWYNNDVSITFSATDCGSGVKEVRYSLDGGNEVVTSGATATVNITAEGEHTLVYYSMDQDGNIESINEVTFGVDKTPPAIAITNPSEGETFSINEVVLADYLVTDAGSGVATVVAAFPDGSPIDTSSIGSYAFTVSATDLAGNENSVTHTFTVIHPGNIDPGNDGARYAWGENVGWINFKPSFGPGVTVTDRGLSGYAWGENSGWINLSLPDIGVFNDGNGNLSGYAWAENVGWISFSCENTGSCGTVDYGVIIDPATGKFFGQAWGENIGWVSFRSTGSVPYGVTTSWPEDMCEGDFGNDNDVDGADLAALIASGATNMDMFAEDFGRVNCP